MKTQTVKQSMIASLIAGLLFLSFAFVQPVSADPYQPDQPSKDIRIDKMVGKPVDDGNYEYVDNLTEHDYKFKASDVIYFRLRVKNTSQADLTDVVVKDFEPSYVTLMNDPGTVSDDTLTINAGDFKPGEEKTYIIRGRIVNSDNLPDGTTCVTNRARAEDDGVADEDTAQFCIKEGSSKTVTTEKVIVEVPTQVPATGAQDSLAVVGGALVLAYLGFKLHTSA